ncbi:COQ9 family protein [Telmatospirillum sp.]|uniref:COQ9 family protein n=1 Tax=Telmatospirillum sp. TaxID=2079197 RepID=UPI00284E7128|nr:COQ9 family protein [Telmatospirillum sp.]MDR3439510.1 COQ9 family protein [Telmatospirillum sp.]
MSEAEKLQELRDRLVLAALGQVPFEGWSQRALQEAAKDLELDPSIGERLFPGGVVEAVGHFSDLADRRMIEAAVAADLSAKRLSDRIRWLIRYRIEAWADQRESVRRAVTYLTLPGHGKVAVQAGWRTADAIWFAAGDKATDFSYYTKRATLTGVFTATLLYWLQDESEEFADSWGFLDRRLADALRFTRFRSSLQKRMAKCSNPLQLLGMRAGARRRFGVHES